MKVTSGNDLIERESSIRVLTVVKANCYSQQLNYYRFAIYEFIGDPSKAQFVEDLGVGFYNYQDACKEAERRAKLLNTIFVPGIQLMDSIDKVYRQALSF